MPDGPQGKENFEYEKNQPRHKYKSTGTEEELGDMHLSTENYSVALEYYDKAIQKVQTIPGLIDVQACFQVAHGTHRRREAILWQKISSPEALAQLLSHEVPPEHRGPDTYMGKALTYRDQWRSRLLRTSAWSPLY